jgi:hypothetical protein
MPLIEDRIKAGRCYGMMRARPPAANDHRGRSEMTEFKVASRAESKLFVWRGYYFSNRSGPDEPKKMGATKLSRILSVCPFLY